MKISAFILAGLSFPLFLFGNQEENPERIGIGVEEVSPIEDLMREHGILNRLLLIYQDIAVHLENFQDFPIVLLSDTAQIIRNFIENYHEKLEEEYIFPVVEKAGAFKDLTATLRNQHIEGRKITTYILAHARADELKDDFKRLLLASYLKLFIRMYRPHEAREDTVLFPEFKKLITVKKYNKLGEIFEDREHQLFGPQGFNKVLQEVVRIEKALNIYNLQLFTPETHE